MNKKADEASAPEGFDLGRLMFQQANKPQPGEIMQMIEQKKLHALLCAYDKAICDPNARIPTMLHAAILSLRK